MRRRFLAMTLGLLVSGVANSRPLTVDEAVVLAMDHSHSIDIAEAGELKSRAELRESFLAFFPSVSMNGGYRFINPVPYVSFDMSALGGGGGGEDPCTNMDPSELPAGFTVEMATGMCYMIMGWMAGDPNAEPQKIPMGLANNYFMTLTAEQVIFAGGAMHNAHAASKDMHRASEEQLRLAEQQAAYDAESSFYQLLLAREAVSVTDEAAGMTEAYVADLQTVVDVGAGSRADLLSAQAQASQARLDAMRTAHGASIAEKLFRVNLGLPEDEPIELVFDPSETLEMPATRETALDEAMGARPELAALDSTVDAMNHYSNATKASWMPSVFVQGNLNWNNPNYANEAEWYRNSNIMLVGAWTLWDKGAAIYKTKAMRAQAAQLTSQRDMLAEMMGVEITAAISTFDESVEELEVAALGLESAEEALRLEQERFANGVANNTQLLAAQTALSGARLSMLQAETQMRISHASIRKALGRDPKVTQ